MLVLVLEISRISAPTLYHPTRRVEQDRRETGGPAGHRPRSVAPPKRKTRVRTYAAGT